MSIRKYFSLYCTDCGREFEEQAEDANILRFFAKERGWKYKKVQNGSYWDFCPRCVKMDRR